MPLHNLNGMNHPAKGSLPRRVDPVAVVDFFCSVQGHPHQEMILREKSRPIIINRQSIGLYGKMQSGVIPVFLLRLRYGKPEKIQSR